MYKLLNILDILTAIVILTHTYLPIQVIVLAGVYILAKGIIFIIISKDIVSIPDTLIGIYILILSFYSNTIITIIAVIWLLQKSIIGLIRNPN